MDELAVVTEQQQTGGVLVQAPHRLHPIHRTLLRSLAQGRGQQGVNAGPGRGLARAFGARWLVQHEVGALPVHPWLTLHFIWPIWLGIDLQPRVFAGLPQAIALQPHAAFLHQTDTHPGGAKTLAVQKVLQLHQATTPRARRV